MSNQSLVGGVVGSDYWGLPFCGGTDTPVVPLWSTLNIYKS